MAQAFVLPKGVSIDVSGDLLSIVYDGDIVLGDSLGKELGNIHAGNDLTISAQAVGGSLRADGVLTVLGALDKVQSIHGREVHIRGPALKCRAITADERVVIGAVKLTVDVLMAPHVQLDATASGRVTIVESHNERGPCKIKGGLSVADYEEMLGDANDFLADRGLEPLAPPSGLPDAPEPSELELDEDDEDIGDPLSLSIEDLELVEADNILHPKLVEAVGRIVSCYSDDDLPPAVEQLRALVHSQDYNALRGSITQVWNGLLGYHQKRGIRPHHQVTHAFNVIHGLIQDAS